MLKWMYETIYNAVADFFEKMGSMGADIFALDWIQATIKLFTLFGWALFIAGVVVAIFDVAIEYQHGRADIKTTSVNILKGFFACSLIGVVPVELYKFCISLQNTFSHDLSALFAGGQSIDLAGQSTSVLQGSFAVATQVNFNLFNILALIAFAYCVVKIFFQNIKRGGILLVQMAVGALYKQRIDAAKNKNNNGVVVYPTKQPYEELDQVGYWCLLNVLKAKDFQEFLGNSEAFDFYCEYAKFDFSRFDVSWLLNLYPHTLEQIAKNAKVKERVRVAIATTLDGEAIAPSDSQRLQSILVKHFC